MPCSESSCIWRAWKVSSSTPMAKATEEFLKMFMNSEVSGGMMMRSAMRQHHVAVGLRAAVKPSARPASRWPRGRLWMPARTCSATRAEVNRPRHDRGGDEFLGRHVLLDPERQIPRQQLRDDEEPEEHLHQQRDVAEQFDPRRASAGEPAAGHGAQRADDDAERQGDDPGATRHTATVQPSPVDQPVEVGLVAALDLLEEDAPVPVVAHDARQVPAAVHASTSCCRLRPARRSGS